MHWKAKYNTFPDKFKKLIQSGKVKLLIACISEATENLDYFEDEVEKFCKVHSIPIDSLLFIDGNMLIEKCKKIKGFYTPHFIYDCSSNISNLIKKRIKFYEFSPTLPTVSESENKLDRDYYFLSLNKNWRKPSQTTYVVYVDEIYIILLSRILLSTSTRYKSI